MTPHAVVWEMRAVQLPFCFRQRIDNPPSVTDWGRQNWVLFLFCWEIPLFFLFFFFCSIQSSGQKPLAPAGGAGLGSSRASAGRWVGAGSGPCPGCVLGSAEGTLEVLLAWGPARGRWDERACGSQSPSLMKQPWFSQQLCNSSPSGRRKNVLKMTFFVSFFSFQPFLSESYRVLVVNLRVR